MRLPSPVVSVGAVPVPVPVPAAAVLEPALKKPVFVKYMYPTMASNPIAAQAQIGSGPSFWVNLVLRLFTQRSPILPAMKRAISTPTTINATPAIIQPPPYRLPGADIGVMTLGSVEKRGT